MNLEWLIWTLDAYENVDEERLYESSRCAGVPYEKLVEEMVRVAREELYRIPTILKTRQQQQHENKEDCCGKRPRDSRTLFRAKL